jgi:hypothetical protein
LRGRNFILWLAAALTASAGPVEFGKAELERAVAERGLRRLRYRTEITSDPPESYRILPGRITGGDLRGLMYGLLEAAEQIRERGRLFPTRGSPATPMRGIRRFLHNKDLEEDWYYSREYWKDFYAMLARNRFNRFTLVFSHQTDYLAPPYPYWLKLPEFPQIRVPGLSREQRERNLEMLRYISQTAADHAIDFTLGVWEHNIQPRMTPTVEGLTPENIGPYSYAALKKILAECPTIRSVQMRTNRESGISGDRQVEFFRDWVFRAIREAGRRVTLDLRGWAMRPGMLDAAVGSDAPLRLSSKYWAEHIGRPYQPAETWRNYSYIDFLRKPRPYDFFWEVWGLGSHRLLLWGDPEFVRRTVPTFKLSGAIGFEIDPPLAQKGFGNRPGKWGIFAESQKGRVFWEHEFERYWLFYLLWGRLSYDPKTPERVWMAEFKRRFGLAAPDVLDAYKSASKVLPQLVAAHMADPNMYIWPEINPGGLIDGYKYIRPSDWRYIASIPEAVRNRIDGVASAKQTPLETAEHLDEFALGTKEAIGRARKKLGPAHNEWRGSEPDFLVLAALARYHARKQRAAYQLTWFYETGDPSGLEVAKRELETAREVWQKLVGLTDGLYPAEMAFGPADVGHWKDKLPYVRHNLKLIEERRKIFEHFGRFDFGFDFGGTVAAPRRASYRRDPYVLANTVEPRFRAVDLKSRYSEQTGYGWVTEGPREANAIRLTPYEEVRAVVRDPSHLPENVLFGDSIRGRGGQTFRVRTGDGTFAVSFLHPDGTTTLREIQAINGVVDVRFPAGEWTICGLVLKGPRSDNPLVAEETPKMPARPTFTHTPPKTALPNRPLALRLGISSIASVKSVRLYYRPLSQLAKFKMLEARPTRPVFTIPAEEIAAQWDLMYYFEVLTKQGTGWFHPDPWVATPYYVVAIDTPTKQR